MVYPELPPGRLWGMLISALSIGTMLFLLALAANHFKRGSYIRLGLNLAFVAGVITWFLAILGWSTTIEMTYEQYAFQLHLTNYLWLLLMVGMLNSSYYLAETAICHGMTHELKASQASEAGKEEAHAT